MSLATMAQSLRQLALAYPETYEESPWGDRVVKVKGKIFFTCGVHEGRLYSSVKLPKSGKELLKRPYAEPTHYGMGKHGWVTLKFESEKKVPVAELKGWIDESFRAIAPKKLIDALGGDGKAVAKKPAAKKATAAKATAATAKGKAILVCGDALRAGRAVKALGERGISVDVVADAGKARLGKAQALIVDIGRNPVEGIELAAKVDASDAAVHLFVVGVRDADQARKLRDLGSAETFRAPPGDGEVIDAVVAALQ